MCLHPVKNVLRAKMVSTSLWGKGKEKCATLEGEGELNLFTILETSWNLQLQTGTKNNSNSQRTTVGKYSRKKRSRFRNVSAFIPPAGTGLRHVFPSSL